MWKQERLFRPIGTNPMPSSLMRVTPELQGKLLTRGSWDHELVDALRPKPGDIRISENQILSILQLTTGQRASVSQNSELGIRWYRH